MNKQNKIILFTIFALSILLRFSLAVVNREANDNHIEPINIIIQQGRLPVKEDCWECAHPKLFYSTIAMILKGFSITDTAQRIVTVQMINFLMSLVILWFLWLFIRSLDPADDHLKLLTFGLLALNPELVGINAQATNDTFVITFSIIALYFARQFIDQKQYRALILTILFSALAILSKTNGLITAFAIGLAILFEALARRNFSMKWGKSNLLMAMFYGLSVLTIVVLTPLSQYITNYQKYGSPLAFNSRIPVQPFPSLFEKTDTYKPGILSIQDGFFTFKFLELLIEPQGTTDNKNYPPHRTSFWTILYGRAHFVQYSQWPPSWVTSSTAIRRLGRIIYLFALLPTLMLVIGVITETRNLFNWIWKGAGAGIRPASAGVFLVAWISILIFCIALALQYRMFVHIKTIFVYPAILALAVFFIVGWNTFSAWFLGKRPWLNSLLRASMAILIGLYALDTFALFLQLQLPH
jgi:hypothetical protein